VSEQLRILVVTNLWPEGGGFRGIFVREQVEALRAIGHHVDVEVVAQSRGRADYLTAAPRVRRRVRSGRYDVVHVHYGLAALAARFTGGVPRVLTLHGSDVWSPWQSLCTRLGSGGVARRIYVSRRVAGIAGDPTATVIPGGVDFGLFTPVDRATARARLGIDHDRPIVLFGARPEQPAKRYDIFRAVVDALRAGGRPVEELVLAAPGQPRSDVPLKFAAADLLLFTSRREHEGSPTVVKEATVMGLPVVSTDVGDVTTVLDGVAPAAVVPFPAGWPDAAAVHELVETLADRAAAVLDQRIRSNGRQRAGWLDATTVARRVADVYREVAARRG
jgi:glycosyltransferase involved in cell wall biosynthesis